jgi:hypothetical protein
MKRIRGWWSRRNERDAVQQSGEALYNFVLNSGKDDGSGSIFYEYVGIIEYEDGVEEAAKQAARVGGYEFVSYYPHGEHTGHRLKRLPTNIERKQ